MDEKLSALHKTNTWDLVPLPLGNSVVGCMGSRLIMISLLSDTKLGWLQKGTVNNMV